MVNVCSLPDVVTIEGWKKESLWKGKSYLSFSFNYFFVLELLLLFLLVQMVLLSLIHFDRINCKSLMGSLDFFYVPTLMDYIIYTFLNTWCKCTSCRLNIKCQMQATLMTNKANICIAKKGIFFFDSQCSRSHILLELPFYFYFFMFIFSLILQ